MTDTPTPAVRVKDGVRFTVISAAGFRLLAAIETAARAVGRDLTITSACDGDHSGPKDPHKRGDAYDIRTRDMNDGQKLVVLQAILQACQDGPDDPALAMAGIARSYATRRFFGWIEAAGQPGEHLHVQLRQRQTYGA